MGRGQRPAEAAAALRGASEPAAPAPGAVADEPGNAHVAAWLSTAERATFGELPRTHQQALITYLAGQADVWPAGRAAEWYAAEYADLRFAVCTVDMEQMGAAIMASNSDMADTFEEYHRLYMLPQLDRPGRGVPGGSTEVWPVILERDNGDVIQDGVHRLTRYVADGRRSVPAIALPDGLVDPQR